MKDFNKIFLVGRLGKDPIQRETKTGIPVVHFSLATSRSVKDQEASQEAGEDKFQEQTQWHNIVVWGKQGKFCASNLKKGQLVFVEGNIRSHDYESKDGTKRTSFEVHAEAVRFMGVKKMEAPAAEAMAM